MESLLQSSSVLVMKLPADFVTLAVKGWKSPQK
jgi:hypothetical protein